GAVTEGEVERRTVAGGGHCPIRRLTRLEHPSHHGHDVLELGGVEVEGDHVGAAPGALEGMSATAGAHIKNAVTGPEAEALVVDREHLDGFPRTDQRRVLGRDALGRRPPGEAIENPTAASL